MRRTLKYIFIALLILSGSSVSNAQTGRKKGLRVGYDVSRLAVSGRNAFEVSGDFEILPKYYATVEYGEERMKKEHASYTYGSSGTYGRIGFDINTLQKKLRVDQYEMSFIGFRYGYSLYHYETPGLTITDSYWNGSTSTSLSRVDARTHWMEVVGGIRGEIFKGVFIGWSVRARLRLANSNSEQMEPLYVPGYGKGSKKLVLGFNYSIYYRLPMYTVKAKNKPIIEE